MEEQVMNENVPVNAGTSSLQVLNEESYTTLHNMLKSSDAADHLMAQQILVRCDVEKSIYWIYKLAKSYFTNRMVNLRTKLGRQFRDDTSLFNIALYSPVAFLKFVVRKEWLTPEIYQNLEEQMIKDYINEIKNLKGTQFYNVTIEVKPEFAQYAANINQIKIEK